MEDWELGCDGDCDTCDDSDCPDHPSQRWKYSPEEAEAEWCQFGSWGLYIINGAPGILSLGREGQVHGALVPRSVKYRMPANFWRGLRSADDTGQSGLGHRPKNPALSKHGSVKLSRHLRRTFSSFFTMATIDITDI